MKIVWVISTLFLVSCASSKYAGWEYVRIESGVPDEKCEYILQETCSLKGIACYDWYKKRATKFNANTVVITQSEGRTYTEISPIRGYSEVTTLTALADYYHCPAKVD